MIMQPRRLPWTPPARVRGHGRGALGVGAVAAATVMIVLVVLGLIAVPQMQHGGGVGSAAIAVDPTGAVPTRAAPEATDFSVPPSAAAAPAAQASSTASPAPGTRPCVSDPAPGQLVISSACVNAAIVPTSIKNGVYQIPPNAQSVGLTGAALTAPDGGASVLAGHVDTNSGVAGALWNLHLVHPGDDVWTATMDGRTQHWRITSAQTVLQSEVSSTGAFTDQGPRRLVIVTCTGAITPKVGYTHNLVVTAIPA